MRRRRVGGRNRLLQARQGVRRRNLVGKIVLVDDDLSFAVLDDVLVLRQLVGEY